MLPVVATAKDLFLPSPKIKSLIFGNHCRKLSGITVCLLVLCSCAKHKIVIPPPKAVKPPISSDFHTTKPYKVDNHWYRPLSTAHDFTQTGLASWYGQDFHGKKTSNGEIYDMYAMTAAHKELPMNTYVSVRNTVNNKSVVLRINDRGPFVEGRIIDLSYTAARRLGIVGPGTAVVEIKAVGKIEAANDRLAKGHLAYQIAAFRDRDNAEKLRQQLAREHNDAYIVMSHAQNRIIYKVRVGNCQTLEQAIAFEEKLKQQGITNAYLVTEKQ